MHEPTSDERPVVSEPRRRAVLAIGAAAALGRFGGVRASGNGPKRFDAGLLWRVARDGKPDSYVFGTIHLADPRVAEPSAAVLAALSRSRTLAMELVVDAMLDTSVFDLEQLENNQMLESLIGADAYAQTRALLIERGVPERVIERMKPWAAMLAVASAGPRDASLTLDARLLAAARRARLRIQSLELVEEQIASFDTIPLASQITLLKHALANPEILAAENRTMIQAWVKGDLAELARFPERMGSQFPGMARHYRELMRHLVYDRTVLMHHRLALPLRSGGVFVAIGALHLQGEKGLLALLEEDGYRVTRID
jgi:uncharacterized protein YbaP (TraB family)